MQTRYYDPTICRFINADTANVLPASPGSATWDKNIYAYCDNNPVSRKDDGGQIWIQMLGGAAYGLATQFAGDLIYSLTTGEKFSVDLKQINAQILRRAGVRHIEISEDCTMCSPERFWSHRVTKGIRGSQGAIIVCKERKR